MEQPVINICTFELVADINSLCICLILYVGLDPDCRLAWAYVDMRTRNFN